MTSLKTRKLSSHFWACFPCYNSSCWRPRHKYLLSVLFVSSQLRNEASEKEITAMTTIVCQQSWWVVAVPAGLPSPDYLHLWYFLASLSTLPPLEHTHMILWSIFQTAKQRWNRCNDPTVNLAYNVAPQRQATPSCVHFRGLPLRQGCQLKIVKN